MSIKLSPEESQLDGKWINEDGRMSGDDVEKRIGWLIQTDLQKIAVGPESGGWDILYRDPSDDRYWELTYPRGEMHGGGPKRLTNIPREAALLKYGLE